MSKRILENNKIEEDEAPPLLLPNEIIQSIIATIKYTDIQLLCLITRVSKSWFEFIRPQCETLFKILYERIHKTDMLGDYWSLPRLLNNMVPTEKNGKLQFMSTHFILCIINAILHDRPTKMSFVKRLSFGYTINSNTHADDIFWVDPENFKIRQLTEIPETTFFHIDRSDKKYEHTLQSYNYADKYRLSQESLIYYKHRESLQVVVNDYEKKMGGLVMNGHHITLPLPDIITFCDALFHPSDRYYGNGDIRVITENNVMSPVFIIMEHILWINIIYGPIVWSLCNRSNDMNVAVVDSKNDNDGGNDDLYIYDQHEEWSEGGTTLYE